MANCKFTYDENKNLWVCEVCGRTVNAPKENIVLAKCKGIVSEPSLPQKMVNYAKAVTKHIFTGGGTRTDEEVKKLLAICKSCNLFNNERMYCTVCGCKCNANKSAFTNKLRMKSQQCPRGKWK